MLEPLPSPAWLASVQILVCLVLIPWAVFVTANIYALRQQVALMRAELELLKRIEQLLSSKAAFPDRRP